MGSVADIYQDCLDFTLGREGSWNPGGTLADPQPTMFGVEQENYDTYRDGKKEPHQSVQLISEAEVHEFYTWYFTRSGAAFCGPLTAMTVFDYAVNGGASMAAIVLQRALGVPADGLIGGETQAAIIADDDAALANKFQWEKLRVYLTIVEKKPQDLPDLPSWLQRTLVFREQHLKPVGL
jgi:lysozyme family protein